MPRPAPIALFAFARPEHTAATLTALADNELASESELVAFCDGPRGPDDEPRVREVRELVHQATGFRRVTVNERPQNMGLARSLIGGISEVLAANDAVIVVEDDLVTSPAFLRYMNEGLRRYADTDCVFSICGYSYPVWHALDAPFFLPGTHPWGWATWARAWAKFEIDERRLLGALAERGLLYDYDIAGSYPHTSLLLQSIAGEVHSWALRWIGTAILHGGLTLYPATSLVQNIGIGEDATNSWDPELQRLHHTSLAQSPPRLPDDPPHPNRRALDLLREFHLSMAPETSIKGRIFSAVSRVAPRAVARTLYSARLRRALAARGMTG